MGFERAHGYAARRDITDDEHDDLAPGRMTRSQALAPGREPAMWVQRKASGAAIAADAERAVGRASTSAGLPLPEHLRRKFEAALGADLSGVRLHTGDASRAAAAALGAQAYTVGQDIHFAAGHDPLADERLLAHEVAHTVQQLGAAAPISGPGAGLRVSSPDDGFEHEADRAADAMVTGGAASVGAAPAVAAPAVAARKVDPERSGPGEITQNNTTGYTVGPTQVHSDADANATVLTTLPAGGWIHIIGSNGSFYIVMYDDTKKGYVDQHDLDIDGTPTAVDHDPAGDAAATATGSAGERYRSAVQKALDFWKGAKEGDDKFTQFRSPATLDKARKAAGLDGKTYTTCIEFLTQVQGDAAHDAHVKQVTTADARFAVAAERKKLPADAWHPASAGMTARPKPGDVFYLTFAKNVYKPDGTTLKFGKGDFSHVGYFNGLEPYKAPTGGDAAAAGAAAGEAIELWHTVDGGQGTATQYDAKGALVRSGHEELKESSRFYIPSKNLIAGEKIQGDADARTLLGWIDIEKLVAADAPPDHSG